jgi:hypothetical protein
MEKTSQINFRCKLRIYTAPKRIRQVQKNYNEYTIVIYSRKTSFNSKYYLLSYKEGMGGVPSLSLQ